MMLKPSGTFPPSSSQKTTSKTPGSNSVMSTFSISDCTLTAVLLWEVILSDSYIWGNKSPLRLSDLTISLHEFSRAVGFAVTSYP